MNYLDYKDKPTLENILAIKSHAKLTQPMLAKLTGLEVSSVKKWTLNTDKRVTPSLQSWNLLIYEIEARNKGYNDLCSLLKSLK